MTEIDLYITQGDKKMSHVTPADVQQHLKQHYGIKGKFNKKHGFWFVQPHLLFATLLGLRTGIPIISGSLTMFYLFGSAILVIVSFGYATLGFFLTPQYTVPALWVFITSTALLSFMIYVFFFNSDIFCLKLDRIKKKNDLPKELVGKYYADHELRLGDLIGDLAETFPSLRIYYEHNMPRPYLPSILLYGPTWSITVLSTVE